MESCRIWESGTDGANGVVFSWRVLILKLVLYDLQMSYLISDKCIISVIF